MTKHTMTHNPETLRGTESLPAIPRERVRNVEDATAYIDATLQAIEAQWGRVSTGFAGNVLRGSVTPDLVTTEQRVPVTAYPVIDQVLADQVQDGRHPAGIEERTSYTQDYVDRLAADMNLEAERAQDAQVADFSAQLTDDALAELSGQTTSEDSAVLEARQKVSASYQGELTIR